MFADRVDAGRQLARRLDPPPGPDVVVVGLPRGGVPVAYEVARRLGAPLDVIVVGKLGLPSQPELAMGAVGEDGALVVNEEVVQAARVGAVTLAAVERRVRAAVEERARGLRAGRAPVSLAGRTVVVVDDGIATGATARAACAIARARGAERVVLAVPVGPPGTAARLADVADEVVCLQEPDPFRAVGLAYADFRSTSEEAVVELLRRAASAPGTSRTPGDGHAPGDDAPGDGG